MLSDRWPTMPKSSRFGQLGAMKKSLLNLSSKECRKEVKVILRAIIIENDFEGEDLFRVSMSCIQKLCMSKVNYMIRYVTTRNFDCFLNCALFLHKLFNCSNIQNTKLHVKIMDPKIGSLHQMGYCSAICWNYPGLSRDYGLVHHR